VLEGLYEDAQVMKARREELQRREDEWAERQRQRHEREANAAAHAALIEQFETDAGAWYRARRLHAYLRALRRRFPRGTLRARFRDTTVDFFDWAQHLVEDLDPLSRAPQRQHSDEAGLSIGRPYRDTTESLARSLGEYWHKASRFETAPERADADIPVYPSRPEPLLFRVSNEPDEESAPDA